MEQFLVKPVFQPGDTTDTLGFPVGSVNRFVDAEYSSTFGAYQSAFGMYGYMRFNRQLEYVLHYARSNPFLLQPHNNCAWNPQGLVTFDSRSIQATRAKINVEQCYDEWFDSTFAAHLEWNGGETVEVDRTGPTDALTRHILEMSALGVRSTLCAGGLFGAVPSFADGVPTTVRDAFLKTSATRKGWMQQARELAATDASEYSHLDNGLIATADISTDGVEYTGDVLALYDARVDAAPRPLKRAVQIGGSRTFGVNGNPLWLVSYSLMTAVYKAKQAEDAAMVTPQRRITVREIPLAGRTPIKVYFIDQTAVIPLEEAEVFADYLDGTPHFDYLTMPGVIQLGGSFGAIPGSRDASSDIAIRVQRSDRNEDYGKITYLSHMLLAAAFQDTDFLAGGYRFNQPA
jgi:hypothetical protein